MDEIFDKEPKSVAIEASKVQYEKDDGHHADSHDLVNSTTFFLKHSYRDVGRKKFHFCLSFCSIFIVVWSSLVINTIVERGPIIFLNLAENENGAFDGIIYPKLQ